MLRVRVSTLLLAAMCALCGACGSSKSHASASTTATTGTSGIPISSSTSAAGVPVDTASELLTISDLPAGWAVKNSGVGGAQGCDRVYEALKQTHPISTASAAFEQGQLPELQEAIAAFATDTSAAAGYSASISDLDNCHSLKTGGATLTIGQMSYPRLGDQSTGYQLIVTEDDESAYADEVVASKGTQVLILEYGSLDTPDLSAIEPLFTAAMAKLT
jgi:hypothetical protein